MTNKHWIDIIPEDVREEILLHLDEAFKWRGHDPTFNLSGRHLIEIANILFIKCNIDLEEYT